MAVSWIANALGGTATTTSFTITLPATQAGDILILEFTHRGTGAGTIAGTYTGSTFTPKHSQTYNSNTFSGKTLWSRCTGDHSGETVTGSGLTNSCAAIINQYRGCTATGDPIAGATVVGEQNASGNETQAEISTGVANTYVVLAVANSPDVNVTSPSCTTPGVLTPRAELLSTGGTDTSIFHASAEKTGTGGTGAFTWAQSDAISGSWAYAITPATGAAGTGTPSIPILTASGVGRRSLKGTGTPSLPKPTASGVGRRSLRGTGAPSIPKPTSSGVGDVIPAQVTHEGTGAGSLPVLTGAGTGKKLRAGTGAGAIPLLTATGAGKKLRRGTGAGALPVLTGAGSGKKTRKGTGAGTLLRITSSGTGELSGTKIGTGAGAIPRLTSSGVGRRLLRGTGAGSLPRLSSVGSGFKQVEVADEGRSIWKPTFQGSFR